MYLITLIKGMTVQSIRSDYETTTYMIRFINVLIPGMWSRSKEEGWSMVSQILSIVLFFFFTSQTNNLFFFTKDNNGQTATRAEE